MDGKDPLVTNDDEDSDKEDDIIKSDDNLFLIALANRDVATLEVHGLYPVARMLMFFTAIEQYDWFHNLMVYYLIIWFIISVYNEAEGSFYCHHDVPISSYPVCMEWLSYDPEDPKPGE